MGKAVSLAILPLLTRIYSPSAFGQLGVLVSIVTIATMMASLRYEVAIPLPDRDNDAVLLLFTTLALIIITSAGCGAILLITNNGILDRLSPNMPNTVKWLFPFALLAAGTYQATEYFGVRSNSHTILGLSQMTRSAGQSGTQLGLGIFSPGITSLFIGFILGRLVGSVVLYAGAIPSQARNTARNAYTKVTELLSQYSRYPKFTMGASLVNSASTHSVPVILSLLYGVETVGFFSLAVKTLRVPIGFIGRPFKKVYMGELPKLIRGDSSTRAADIRELLDMSVRSMILWGGMPILAAGIIAPFVATLLFGPEWKTTGYFVLALTPKFVGQASIVPVSDTLNYLGQQHLQLTWDVTRLALAVGAILMPWLNGLGSLYTISFYSIGLLLAYAGYYGLCVYSINQRPSPRTIQKE